MIKMSSPNQETPEFSKAPTQDLTLSLLGGGIPYRPSLLEAGFTQNLTWVSEIIDLLFKLIAIVYFCTIFGIIPHKGYSQGHLKLRKYDIGKIQNGPQYPYRTSKKTFLGFCTHVPNNSEFLVYLPIC